MTVIEKFKAEHEVLLLAIRILDQIMSNLGSGQAIDLRHLDQIIKILQDFVDSKKGGRETSCLVEELFSRQGMN